MTTGSQPDLYTVKLTVDHSTDYITLSDKNGIIIYANQAVGHLTGFSQVIVKKATNTASDSGYDTSPTEKPEVFSEFFRLWNVLLAKPQAPSIGLFKARQFVDLSGIWFESLVRYA